MSKKKKKNPWSNTEGPLEGEKNPENDGKANKNRNVREISQNRQP